MPYLIDGHNLIPKIPGFSLEEMDDEQRLLEMLGEYCRKTRKQAEVFFDNAPPGGVRVRNLGLLIARFVRQGMTADEAIRQRLQRLGREARNWTVVSSDQAVQAATRASQAHTISSSAFARTMLAALEATAGNGGDDADPSLNQEELSDWLKLFGDQG